VPGSASCRRLAGALVAGFVGVLVDVLVGAEDAMPAPADAPGSGSCALMMVQVCCITARVFERPAQVGVSRRTSGVAGTSR
jgi:hypothetical protein